MGTEEDTTHTVSHGVFRRNKMNSNSSQSGSSRLQKFPPDKTLSRSRMAPPSVRSRRVYSTSESSTNSTSTNPDASTEAILQKLHTIACGTSKYDDPRFPITKDNCTSLASKEDQSTTRNFGEDACFISSTNTADIIGVSDGVGGWQNYGVDPSEFSRHLVQTLAFLVEENKFNVKRPVEYLSRAYDDLIDYSEDNLIGSATACVGCFDRRSKIFYTANLGDSGFVVIRQGQVIARSRPQLHNFNAPFQLCKVPDNSNYRNFDDDPEMSDFQSVQCQEGDIIVMATDGLFDNVYEQHIVTLLQHSGLLSGLEDEIDQVLESAAKDVVSYSRYRANEQGYDSPFAREASEVYRRKISGGKVDDITVLVSVVRP